MTAKSGHFTCRITRCHQRLADQHRSISSGGQGLRIATMTHTRFGDRNDVVRHCATHSHCTLMIDSEGNEIALIHPDQRRSNTEGNGKFCLIMNLNQHIKPNLNRK
jgi:hypothetical protein